MSLTLRATTPEDGPELARFLREAFGMPVEAPAIQPRLMAWKYWDLRSDWTAPRSWVLEKERVIVAHAGLWPLVFGEGPDAVRGIQMIDWGASKQAAGAGLSLVQRFASMFDFIYSIGGSEATRKVLPMFGFRICGNAWRAARPLRPLGQILTHQERTLRLVPRLFRNWAWSRWPAAIPAPGWNARRVEPEELVLPATDLCTPRPRAFFDYLLRCPAAEFSVWQILKAGKPAGFFCLSVLRGQARIAGVWIPGADPDYWQTAYSLAQQAALSMEGAFEITAEGMEGTTALAAERAGLRIRNRVPVFLMNKTGKLFLPDNFQFQLADDDAAFLDSGSYDYLT